MSRPARPPGGPTWGRAEPVLVAAAHGTRLAAGRARMAQLRLEVAAARPGLTVAAANVDEAVQRPGVDGVVARAAAVGRPSVVVPLLLSAGYHVFHDVARSVATAQGWAAASEALGPDPGLVAILHDRMTEVCGPDGLGSLDAVVLAAAGSSDPRAVADVEATGRMLADAMGRPVTCAYLSAAHPRVEDAVASLRAAGAARIGLAAYLLAPGMFTQRLDRCGADAIAAPLAPHPLLTDLILRRYDDAAATAVAIAAG